MNENIARNMTILGIETSCDETAMSIIKAEGSFNSDIKIQIITNEILSQIALHSKFGGVFPNLAKREHTKNLPVMLKQTLRSARLSSGGLDAIALTTGPGLEPCLWAGIVFAEEIASKWNVPIVPINHMEGHIFAALIKRKDSFISLLKPKFPAIALLISGGHTELILMKDWFDYKIIGQTRDDAVGEAFDKVARILGLPYPGGPEISKLAELARKAEITKKNKSDYAHIALPRPMLHSGNLDLSFSGLKTAVLYLVERLGKIDNEIKSIIAEEFEDAVTEVLISKTKTAIEEFGANSLIIGGGVIANTHIRENFKEIKDISLFIPEKNLATDNALMIAIAGFLRLQNNNQKNTASALKARGNLRLDEEI